MLLETYRFDGKHFKQGGDFSGLGASSLSVDSHWHDEHILSAGRKIGAGHGMNRTNAQASSIQPVKRLGNFPLGRGTLQNKLALMQIEGVLRDNAVDLLVGSDGKQETVRCTDRTPRVNSLFFEFWINTDNALCMRFNGARKFLSPPGSRTENGDCLPGECRRRLQRRGE